MKLIIKQGDWTTKNLRIKNRTVRVLSTGKIVPTTLASFRQAAKI